MENVVEGRNERVKGQKERGSRWRTAEVSRLEADDGISFGGAG